MPVLKPRQHDGVCHEDGKCTLVCGKNNKGIYIAVVNDDEYEQALQAAKNCPVNIIKVKKR